MMCHPVVKSQQQRIQPTCHRCSPCFQVTGSHSIGGFRRVSSPGQTDCPFTPFDCTPSGQFSLPAPPMDNSVFRVACAGVRGVSAQPCAWSTMCTNPAVDETSKGCPFNSTAREGFATCEDYRTCALHTCMKHHRQASGFWRRAPWLRSCSINLMPCCRWWLPKSGPSLRLGSMPLFINQDEDAGAGGKPGALFL